MCINREDTKTCCQIAQEIKTLDGEIKEMELKNKNFKNVENQITEIYLQQRSFHKQKMAENTALLQQMKS